MKNIFLVGMPVSGKSYWGNELAANYRCKFIDLDKYIEERETKTIPSIFAMHLEQGFREIEHDALEEIIRDNPSDTVIASGGGTPCFHDNMSLMKTAGCVVYLEASVDLLLERLQDDMKVRPLLDAADHMHQLLNNLYQKRRPIYELAHYTLPTGNISLTNFGEIIAACTNGH